MAKRPAGSEGEEQEEAVGAKRARKLYTEEEMQTLCRAQVERAIGELRCTSVAQAAVAQAPVPVLLQETFTPNDPVHGLMHLPAIVKIVVDTASFQRMRHIKQLGLCGHVFPGATHNRFFHSIGTAFLAHELIKGLRQRQPELGVTDRDVLCATLAALCHDLGHPCYSHMFEVFVHSLGRDRRRRAEAAASGRGEPGLRAEEEAEIRPYETWTHEAASVFLLKRMFKDLKVPLEEAGLRADLEGDDFVCIAELIDPPKKELEQLLEGGQLRERWSDVIKGRPVGKAWLYEIVSNWRSGIDVDKFDYFRRDALFLGIQRQFDHNRYLQRVKVIQDAEGVPTISPPDKEKDMLRESMLELRKMLHRAAYQHKTVKKLEAHMIDIMKLMDAHVRITGVGGRKLSMSQAAIELDPVAYPKLTDTFVEARLLDGEDPSLGPAAAEYEYRIVRRELMRLVGDWDLPWAGETDHEATAVRPIPLPEPEAVIAAVHALYGERAALWMPQLPVRDVTIAELRCSMASFHYGMGARDPITRVLFHSSKSDARCGFAADRDAKPLRQKVFFFWNPADPEARRDELTCARLTLAFQRWAERQVELHGTLSVAGSPMGKPPASPPKAPRAARPRRALMIQASCPVSMPDPVAKA